MLEIEKVKEKIQLLDASEAKSLLLIIYARLDSAINGNAGDSFNQKTLNDIFEMYSKLPNN